MKAIVALFSSVVLISSAFAEIHPSKLNEILYNLLKRSPEYQAQLGSYLQPGLNSEKFKGLARELLAHPDIVDVVEGFYNGEISWTKQSLEADWEIVYKDPRYKKELEEAYDVLNNYGKEPVSN